VGVREGERAGRRVHVDYESIIYMMADEEKGDARVVGYLKAISMSLAMVHPFTCHARKTG